MDYDKILGFDKTVGSGKTLGELIDISKKVNGILKNIGLDKTIQLPKIVVNGTQSSGKSSLLNKIIGLNIFPTGTNMTTRTPIELFLKKGINNNYNITFYKCVDGKEYEEFKIVYDVDKINFDEIQNKIMEITNSLTLGTNNISFNSIIINIESDRIDDFSLVDLPGIIAVAKYNKGQSHEIIAQIKQLIKYYLERPKTIVCTVVQSKLDLETDLGIGLIRDIVSTSGTSLYQTIGVLTKPDLLEKDTDLSDILSDEIDEALKMNHGYYVVNNKTSDEVEYFKSYKNKKKCGHVNLLGVLKEILYKSLLVEIPKLYNELRVLKRTNEIKLLDIEEKSIDTDAKRSMIFQEFVKLFSKRLTECIESEGVSPNIGQKIKEQMDIFNKELAKCDAFSKANLSDIKIADLVRSYKGYKLTHTIEPLKLLERIFQEYDKPMDDINEITIEYISNITEILLRQSHIILNSIVMAYPMLASTFCSQIEKIILRQSKIARDYIQAQLQLEKKVIWTNDSKFASNLDKIGGFHSKKSDTISISDSEHSYESKIRELFKSYYLTVKATLNSFIQKSVIGLIIKHLEDNIDYELFKLMTEIDLSAVITENTKIGFERKKIITLIDNITAMVEIINS
jgi:GTP-binding protein EngB required for normal cell division